MNLRCLGNTVFLSDNFRIIYVSMIFFGTDDKNGFDIFLLEFLLGWWHDLVIKITRGHLADLIVWL